MLSNYLTSAIRALRRDKFHSALNITGLTVSLAVAFLIALYVKHELSYENFFTEPERVFTVQSQYHPAGNQQPSPPIWLAPYGLFTTLRANLDHQLTSTFALYHEAVDIRVDDRVFHEIVNVVDEHFFDVFDYKVVPGGQVETMVEPNKVALTQLRAIQMFGRSNIVGETLTISGQDMEVAIVLEDFPANSDLPFHGIFTSAASPYYAYLQSLAGLWSESIGYLFVRLKDGVEIQSIENQLPLLADQSMPEVQKAVAAYSATLIRLDQIHFGIDAYEENRTALIMLASVAFLLCVIACFNYINLSTAKALSRAKEVGIRKILGARKDRLVYQFLSETLLTTSLSFALALCLAALLLPVFSNMVARPLTLSDLLSPPYLLIVVSLTVVVSLLSGVYPANRLASARPHDLFDKPKVSSGRRSKLRTFIVGTQFGLTVSLIVVASVFYSQATHMNLLDLGFDKEGVLIIPDFPDGDPSELKATYNQRLAESPYVQMVATSSTTPTERYENASLTSISRLQNETYQRLAVAHLLVDDSFFELYGIPTIAGRTYSGPAGSSGAANPRDMDLPYHGKTVISESAVPYLGFSSPEEALGELLIRHTGRRDSRALWEVVGVTSDIHFRLAQSPLEPMIYLFPSEILTANRDGRNVTSARITSGSEGQALDHARQIWDEMSPDHPFEYDFLEDRVETANADKVRTSHLFVSLTGLAILVTCIGLFGLVSFVAARRTREIAIRKVLGAKVGDVTRMLLWEFAKPILVANLIAWPIAWVLMRRWLDGFPYRIELSPWFFVGATTLALAVAFLTVIGRTWKAAQTHPAQALKYE